MTVNTDWVAIHSSLVESTWYVMKKSHYSDTQFSSKYTALVCQTKHVNPTLQTTNHIQQNHRGWTNQCKFWSDKLLIFIFLK